MAEQWAKGISEIRLAADLGDNLASINRKTGVVYINNRRRKELTADEWYNVLLHELGHLVLKSHDEIAVDEWAFNEYAKTGASLKASVSALNNNLNHSIPEHRYRANLQLQRAQNFDLKNNNHGKGKKKNQKIKLQSGSEGQRNFEKRIPLRQGWSGSKIKEIDMDALARNSDMLHLVGQTNVEPETSDGGWFSNIWGEKGDGKFLGVQWDDPTLGNKITKATGTIAGVTNDVASIWDSLKNPGQKADSLANPQQGQQPYYGQGSQAVTASAPNTTMILGIGTAVLVVVLVLVVMLKKK